MEEILILQQTEFQILAAAVNFTKIYGIRPESFPDESAFMYGVHEMVQKGILKEQNEKFVLQEPYRTAFLSMKDAETILAVESHADAVGNSCFYFGEKLITLEESLQDEAAFRIGVSNKEDLYELLEEKGFLPKPLLEPDVAVLQEVEELQEAMGDTPMEKSIYAQYLIFYPKNGQQAQKTLYLINNPYNYWIAEKEGNQTRFFHYNQESMYESLRQALRYTEEQEGVSYDIG